MVSSILPLWLLLAGVPSLLYALTNHIDKHLLDEHFADDLGPFTLLIISALVSAVALPFLWLLSPVSVLPEEWSHVFVFALIGVLHVGLLWFYLKALQEEDTVTIIIFYSVLPIMGLVSANLFLDETLSSMQLVAMAVTICGVLIVSVEWGEKGEYRLKLRAAFLMCMASLCWALGDVTFKFIAIEENIWSALFWEHLILFVFGFVALAAAPRVRKRLAKTLTGNSTEIIGLNLTSETLYILANVISAFPLLMVQVAAIHMVQAFQPVWVFLIALCLWRLGVSSERLSRVQLLQKGTATVIAVFGMYLLTIYTPN